VMPSRATGGSLPDEEKDGFWETLLGVVVLVALSAGGIFGVRALYTKFFAPTPLVVSLSAYFIDDAGTATPADSSRNGFLRIRGDVSQGGQSVKAGNVRVTVIAKDDFFRQSVSSTFQNGHFAIDDPAFRSIRPGDKVEVDAEVSVAGLNQTASIHLNSKPPVDKTAIEYGLGTATLLLAVVFFLAFTGRKTAWRNQTAIIFSYLVIAIFLAVPILAPTMLIRTFPSAVYAMIGAPAGLINTHTPNQPNNETQWALNIGGFSYRKTTETPKKAKAGDTTSPDKSAAAQEAPKAGTGSGNPKEAGNAFSSPNATEASRPSPPQPADASTANGAAASPTPEPLESSSAESAAPVVQVQGGLVIPLYVIILSVIGGAINMTRKVPGFQREGEESDFSLARPISRAATAVLNLARPATGAGNTAQQPAQQPAAPPMDAATKGPGPSLEDQAKAITDQLGLLVRAQLQRNGETDTTLVQIRTLLSKMQELFKSRTTDEPLLKFNSFEDWAAGQPRLGELLRGSWRVELLNQYMYLISAPFLAIVTYYILDLLGLSKQGVVVVLSFSVGLVSERIVSWILGIATGYLRTDTGKTAVASTAGSH
jgi:hypothetical protein